MKKFWLVYNVKNSGTFPRFDSLAEAMAEAKRLQFQNQNDQYIILEAVKATVKPVPEIEIKDL